MQNILVTGGAGFIGSHFVHYLLRLNPPVNVVNLDLLTYSGTRENLDDLKTIDRHTFVHGDICDSELVQRILVEYRIDTIVNFAAESHVDRSIADPENFIKTNIWGVFNLLECARKAWNNSYAGKRFHQVSTDEVYGELEEDSPEFTESSPYCPRSPYSASKASADHLVRSYFYTYNFPVTISICSNNYGPNQFPEKLVPLTILNALEKKTIPLYGDGRHIRDWIFVWDHCDAIFQIITKGVSGETYNVGGRSPLRNIDLVKKACDFLDQTQPSDIPYSSLIAYVSDRPGHDRRYALNINKIEEELGWKPLYNIDTGLLNTVKWYLMERENISKRLESHEYVQWIRQNYENREL